jgi:hypothetical protein
MIIDATQLLHFKAILGVMDRDSGLLKRHVAPNVVNRQEKVHVVRDVDCVHLIVLIELEKLHRVALQIDLFLRLLVGPLHVHVVVLVVLIVNLNNSGEDLIIIATKQLLDDDVDDRQ